MTKMWTMRSDHRGVWKKVTLVWCRTDICRKLSGRRRQGRAAHRIGHRGPRRRDPRRDRTSHDVTRRHGRWVHKRNTLILRPGRPRRGRRGPEMAFARPRTTPGCRAPGGGGHRTSMHGAAQHPIGIHLRRRTRTLTTHATRKVAYLRDETTSSFRFQKRQAASWQQQRSETTGCGGFR